MRRHAVGLIALSLLGTALALWLWMPSGTATGEALIGACSRVGILMAVLWLAYREIERLPPWILAVIPVLLAILAVRPRWALYLIPVVVVLAVLHRLGQRK